jgi:hypothetical protein
VESVRENRVEAVRIRSVEPKTAPEQGSSDDAAQQEESVREGG